MILEGDVSDSPSPGSWPNLLLGRLYRNMNYNLNFKDENRKHSNNTNNNNNSNYDANYMYIWTRSRMVAILRTIYIVTTLCTVLLQRLPCPTSSKPQAVTRASSAPSFRTDQMNATTRNIYHTCRLIPRPFCWLPSFRVRILKA